MDRTDNYIKIYSSFKEQFNLLNDEELGKLIKALLSYAQTEEEPQDLSPLLKMAFAFVNSANQNNKKCSSHFKIYISFEEQFNLLNDDELGKLIKALLSYTLTGEEPQDLSPLLKMAFAFVNSANSQNNNVKKAGAPTGNQNKKGKSNKINSQSIENQSQINSKSIENQSQINSNQLPINSNQLPINSNQLPINSKSIENQLPINSNQLPINSNQLKINSNQLKSIDVLVENSPIVDNSVDNFVDNSLQSPPSDAEIPIYNIINKQDKDSLVSLVCRKKENKANNNMCARTHEEILEKLNQKFESLIKGNNHNAYTEILKMVINMMAELIDCPPNKKYTSDQIQLMIFNLTDDEMTKICGSFRMNPDIKKPQIYLLTCLARTEEERLLKEK